jgi:hypothetical protein
MKARGSVLECGGLRRFRASQGPRKAPEGWSIDSLRSPYGQPLLSIAAKLRFQEARADMRFPMHRYRRAHAVQVKSLGSNPAPGWL